MQNFTARRLIAGPPLSRDPHPSCPPRPTPSLPPSLLSSSLWSPSDRTTPPPTKPLPSTHPLHLHCHYCPDYYPRRRRPGSRKDSAAPGAATVPSAVTHFFMSPSVVWMETAKRTRPFADSCRGEPACCCRGRLLVPCSRVSLPVGLTIPLSGGGLPLLPCGRVSLPVGLTMPLSG